MELMKLTAEIYEISRRLGESSKAIFKLGKEKAESERVYRMELAKELLRLKSEGMAVGLLGDVARGNIADLLFKRDLGEIQYKSAVEAMDVLKAQLTALQTIAKYQENL